MKRSTILTTAFALAALWTAFATLRAETMKEYPDLKPGELTLTDAELPLAIGELGRGGVGALGGANPIDDTTTETLKVWLFQPTDETEKTEAGFPLLVFLHGAGERGDDAEAVKVHGPPKILAKRPEEAKEWKFFTVAPQCKANRFWSPEQIHVLIEQICANYPIDRSRIYITGISMGGYGTWGVVAKTENLVAAAAPICGGYDLDFAPKMATTPLWVFHGDADSAVPYSASRDLVDAVRKAGNEDVKFTTYPGVGHDCWTQTYDNPELYRWLLTKKLEK